MKRHMQGGDEYDAFTKWRRMYYWQRGELRRIKRQANKRERRIVRNKIRDIGEI